MSTKAEERIIKENEEFIKYKKELLEERKELLEERKELLEERKGYKDKCDICQKHVDSMFSAINVYDYKTYSGYTVEVCSRKCLQEFNSQRLYGEKRVLF